MFVFNRLFVASKSQVSLEYILLVSAAIVFIIIVAVLVRNVVMTPVMNQSSNTSSYIRNVTVNLTNFTPS